MKKLVGKTKTNYSRALQLGKAGEHLVCADLILQGYGAHLTDKCAPFDIVMEKKGSLYRIEVKSTLKTISTKQSKNIYRVRLRHGKGGKERLTENHAEYFAFIALDINKIAYISAKKLSNDKGKIPICVEFRTKDIPIDGRKYENGSVRKVTFGR